MALRRHRRLRRLVQAYLDHEIGGEDARVAAQHLERCFECNTDAEIRALVRASLRRAAGRTAPPRVSARVLRYANRLAAGP